MIDDIYAMMYNTKMRCFLFENERSFVRVILPQKLSTLVIGFLQLLFKLPLVLQMGIMQVILMAALMVGVVTGAGLPSCVSRCESLASWSRGVAIDLDNAVQGGTGSYGARYDAKLELVKTTYLTEACQNACANNVISRSPKPEGIGPLGYSKAFHGGHNMELPADAFNVASSVVNNITLHQMCSTDVPSNVMTIVTGTPPTHSVAHYTGDKRWEYPNGAFQTHKSFHFHITYQVIKVLQCVTTKDHYRTCCDRFHNGGRNKMFHTRAQTLMGTEHAGSCNTEGACWDWQSPPVACSVQKSGVVHQICLTHIQETDEASTAKPVTPQRCWRPHEDARKPMPFDMQGTVDWTANQDNGNRHVVCRGAGCGSMRDCVYDPVWKCTMAPCSQYRCDNQRLSDEREWIKTEVLIS